MISDLHIGPHARAKDFCPTPTSSSIDDNYVATFKTFVEARGIEADYLLIPGDISDEAQPAEFELASHTIPKLAEALKVPPSQVLFVPGNHDVDWTVMRLPDSTGFRRSQRYAPLLNPGWIFEKIASKASGALFESPYFCHWADATILVIGYNSAWHDEPSAVLHHGHINDESIEALDRFFRTLPENDPRVRVFLVHHHPMLYSDPPSPIPDFSAMVNAPQLLSVLSRHRTDLLVHGHKHAPHFSANVLDSSHPLVTLGAGSFSVLLDSRWAGHVNNQFHRITVSGRDATECIHGVVESWTFVHGKGWTDSQRHNGIPHRQPFGAYERPAALRALLEPIIADLLSRNDYAKWDDDVCAGVPHLRNLPSDRIADVLENLAPVLGFEVHGVLPEEVILLRRRGRSA